MFNYSMMNPMMMSQMSGLDYGSGNTYVSMRARYGYPYARLDMVPTPIAYAPINPQAVTGDSFFVRFLKKFF